MRYLFAFIAVCIFGLLGGSYSSAQITGGFSVDNSYSVWIGDANGVIGAPPPTLNNIPIPGGNPIAEHTNTQASEISYGETFEFDPVPQCFIYIAAWSDDSSYQGMIGSFSGGLTLSTGDSKIQVAPSFINKNDQQFPSENEVHTAIQNANANGSWVTPTIDTTNQMAIINPLLVPGLAPNAEWVWYDTGNHAASGAPFRGFNHDEFLIFRIPCADLEDPSEPVNCPECDQCCPPWNKSQFEKIFEDNGIPGNDYKFRIDLAYDNLISQQMQAYVNYIAMLDPNIESIGVGFVSYDCGVNNPASGACNNATEMFSEAFTWEAGNPTPSPKKGVLNGSWTWNQNYSPIEVDASRNNLYQVLAIPFKKYRNGEVELLGFNNDCEIPKVQFNHQRTFGARPVAPSKPRFSSLNSQVFKRGENGRTTIERLKEASAGSGQSGSGNSDKTEWTPWYNTDRPGGNGDYQTLKGLLDQGKACPEPADVECRTVFGKKDWRETGQTMTCSVDQGAACTNKRQKNGRCEDYEVRFSCPAK